MRRFCRLFSHCSRLSRFCFFFFSFRQIHQFLLRLRCSSPSLFFWWLLWISAQSTPVARRQQTWRHPGSRARSFSTARNAPLLLVKRLDCNNTLCPAQFWFFLMFCAGTRESASAIINALTLSSIDWRSAPLMIIHSHFDCSKCVIDSKMIWFSLSDCRLYESRIDIAIANNRNHHRLRIWSFDSHSDCSSYVIIIHRQYLSLCWPPQTTSAFELIYHSDCSK